MFVFGARKDEEDVTCLADLVRLRVSVIVMPAKIKALQAKGKATWEKDVYVDVVCECLQSQKLYSETVAQTLRILATLPGAVPLTVADIKRAGANCWQWSAEEYGYFIKPFETVLPAVAMNIASLELDVDQLLHWLDEQRASWTLPSLHAVEIKSLSAGSQGNHAVAFGVWSGSYGNHVVPIEPGVWFNNAVVAKETNHCGPVPLGYYTFGLGWRFAPKCLVHTIVHRRWSGPRAAWLAACCCYA
jgi:hypothetical protein